MVRMAVDNVLVSSPSKWAPSAQIKKILAGLGIVCTALIATAYVYKPTPVVDLGVSNHMRKAGVYNAWAKGDIIVLVRHAERCDRSKNPCLGPDDGITVAGSAAAASVGKALATMGLGGTDILTSPITRTQQTALFMFGQAVAGADWLSECKGAMLRDALAHKTDHRNLVLVTHSGCISEFEDQLKMHRAPSSEYTSALFVSVDENGKAKPLGIMNAEEWQAVLAQK